MFVVKRPEAKAHAPAQGARPTKPPYSAVLVVEASERLSFGEKAVWRRIWALDQEGAGCFASAERLAEDLGTGARNVEKMRSRLYQVGLVARYGKGGRSGYRWVATLPPAATPSRKISHTEKLQLREALDAAIRHSEEDRARPETPNDSPGFTYEESPNDSSGFRVMENADQSVGSYTGKPEESDGVKRGSPNNRSPEVIEALPTEILDLGELVEPSDLSARSRAREVRAVGDGRKLPLANLVSECMAPIEAKRRLTA